MRRHPRGTLQLSRGRVGRHDGAGPETFTLVADGGELLLEEGVPRRRGSLRVYRVRLLRGVRQKPRIRRMGEARAVSLAQAAMSVSLRFTQAVS